MNVLLSLPHASLPSFLTPFVSLSHQVPAPEHPDSFPNSTYHDIGRLDACLIVTIIAILALLRDATRLLLLEPFARWKLTRDWNRRRASKSTAASGRTTPTSAATTYSNGNGHLSEKPSIDGLAENAPEPRHLKRSVLRFAEQGWYFIYYLAQWLFGLYIYCNVPADIWTGYPHTPLAGPIKLYYLVQLAYYCHAMLVLNAEARRKDHWQMFTHHVITVVLIVLSYTYNFTRVGCLVMVIMDWIDIVLPFAKMLRYMGYQTACDGAFVVFLLSWLFTRHYLFVLVIISTHYQAPKSIPLVWKPEIGHYVTAEVLMGFVVLLSLLELLQIAWAFTIFSLAWRVVSGQSADDPRSDDEDDEDVKKER